MCGIRLGLYAKGARTSQLKHSEYLLRRGPDTSSEIDVPVNNTRRGVFQGFTLHFQGALTPQPLQDDDANILLWNGEIYSGLETSSGNDAQALSQALQRCDSQLEILQTLQAIVGPWAFIYWQEAAKTLWFGRCVFGRRSLLMHVSEDRQTLVLSSVACSKSLSWTEVPANGIFHITLADDVEIDSVTCHPYVYSPICNNEEQATRCSTSDYFKPVSERASHICEDITIAYSDCNVELPFSRLNDVLPETSSPDPSPKTGFAEMTLSSRDGSSSGGSHLENVGVDALLSVMTPYHDEISSRLLELLGVAVQVRVERQSHLCHSCITKNLHRGTTGSGDSCGIHQSKAIPNMVRNRAGVIPGEGNRCGHARVGVLYSGGIDSLVLAALADRFVPPDEPIDLLNVAFEQLKKPCKQNTHKISAAETHSCYDVPDRLTGRDGLSQLNPKRQWNFIEVDVSVEELKQKREDTVSDLIYPLSTVLDDSIGCAIWFAARGQGHMETAQGRILYTTSARVLLVGMGADEQLAGYSRHRVQFKKAGWSGLIEELQMELERISARNMGRDDRIISDHAREARFPFLDEQLVAFLNRLPVDVKADLRLPRGVGEKYLLRLAAHKLGLVQSATLPKRAIQFGSRIAKIENRKEKGSDVCARLDTGS